LQTTAPLTGPPRDQRAGPVCGLLLVLAWSPMAVAIPRLPDLGSANRVAEFWRSNTALMRVVIVSVSVGYLFLLVFLGALTDRMRRFEGPGPLAFAAFGSAVMFMTLLNVAVGLDAAGGLLLPTAGPDATYLLHAAGFILAAPAAFAGVAFFAALAVLIRRTAVFPRWLGRLALLGAVGNVGAVGGSLTLTGPWNAGNGVLAGIAAPLGLFLLWTACASAWWLRDLRPGRSGRSGRSGTVS
jgi:hypothetical protein